MSSPTVLLTGATAQVGLHILPALLKAGINTVALSRKIVSSEVIGHPSGANLLWLHSAQFKDHIGSDKAMAEAGLGQPEWLISAGPIKLATECLDSCSSLRQIVCLSTSSVFSKVDSSNPGEKKQIKEILEAEAKLISTCSDRALSLVILRPTLIYGCGMDENISRMAQFIRRFGFLPLAGAAQGLRQPIHVADLAELMVAISRAGVSGQSSFEVAGGRTLSYREMALNIFQALGKPQQLLSLPPMLLASIVAVANKLPGLKGLNPQMVLRQNQDLIFADDEVRQRFDFRPRGFHPGPEDFSLPEALKHWLPTGLRNS